ncbi:MAG: glycosyltransferase [Clostridia bacterium]|nr:glycosyltransferase [Clostridia bacterium]
MDELITVIINVYNREDLIQKCLESVINQTYKNLEILIINDGSTDNTLKICESYKDSRIRIITTENMGLSMSRNVGIENSKGEYLYFVDSDDFIEDDTIEYLYGLCKKNDVKLSTCMSNTINNYNFTKKESKEKVKIIDSYEMLKKVVIAKDTAGTTWNKLYKKELFDNIRFEKRIVNDIVVTYKVVIEAKKIAYSNLKKYYYLKHKDAITIKNRNHSDRAMDLYNAAYERYNYLKKIYPNFLENDIGMIRNIIKVYLTSNSEVEKFLKEQEAFKLFKELFSPRILTSRIGFKLKSVIVLFDINPKLCKKIWGIYDKRK